MSDNERLFLMEHKDTYYIPDIDDHSDHRIRQIISDRVGDEFDGLCTVHPMLFDKTGTEEHDYRISCTVILQFPDTLSVNKFKIKFMSHLDNIVEIKS